MDNKLIYLLIGGFLLGVFFASLVRPDFYFYIFLLFLAISLLLGGFFLTKDKSSAFLLGALLIFAFLTGSFRFDLERNSLKNQLPVNTALFFEGVITEEPDYRENTTLLTVSISKIDQSTTTGKILMFTDSGVNYKYGDKISFFGSLEKPKNFETDTGRIFDYQSYLKKEGINYIISRPHITVLEERAGNPIKQVLFDTKGAIVSSYEKVINEPESSLLGGLLLGLKQGLGKEWSEILRKAGIIHIVVLSGYNITIVAKFIMWMFQGLTLKWRLSSGILAIIAFAVMTGGSATVVRASLMALFVLLADFIKRKYDVTRALIIAGVLMVLQNPQILVFDLSFQLSFLATVGLVYVSPIVEKFVQFTPQRLGFREIVVATIATQIFVLPFLLYSIGMFSFVALIVNLLVLPIIPFAMFTGFLSAVFGFFLLPLSIMFGLISYWLLHYVLIVSEYFGELPFASYTVPQFSALIMFFVYILMIFGIWIWYKRKAVLDVTK